MIEALRRGLCTQLKNTNKFSITSAITTFNACFVLYLTAVAFTVVAYSSAPIIELIVPLIVVLTAAVVLYLLLGGLPVLLISLARWWLGRWMCLYQRQTDFLNPPDSSVTRLNLAGCFFLPVFKFIQRQRVYLLHTPAKPPCQISSRF